MLKQIDGKWALVSKKTLKPLAYYKGVGKPSDDWIQKQEARVHFFKEASYVGNIGAMEMFKFFNIATKEQKNKLKSLIDKKDNKKAWELVQQVTGVKLHKSINEEVKPDILPKSGAGQDGTNELVNNYKNDTPGQGKIKSFRDYRK
jgi:hypothetical protein